MLDSKLANNEGWLISQNSWRSGTHFTFDQYDWVRKQGVHIEHNEMDRASSPYQHESNVKDREEKNGENTLFVSYINQ